MNVNSIFASALHIDVEIGEYTRTVIVANTPMTRTMGLSGTETLTDIDGMLFVFDTDQFIPFTAEKTLIPLVLAFYDENGEFLAGHMLEPGDPGPFWPPQPFRYAVEVPPELFVPGILRVNV